MRRDPVIRIVNDDDGDDVLADGESIRVPVYLCDTVQLTDDGPRFLRMANEGTRDARAAARDEMIWRAEDAWKVDVRRKAKPPDDDDDGDDGEDTMDANIQQAFDVADHRPGFRYATDAARVAVRDARDEMIRRATTAWRTPQQPQRTTRSRDAAEPDMGTSVEELAVRRHLYGAPGLGDPSTSHAAEFRGEQAQRERDRAWTSYKDQLTNAWRGGRTDPRRAAQEESRLERWKASSE